MFNGIIFNQGRVHKIFKRKKGINLFVKSSIPLKPKDLGISISCDGVIDESKYNSGAGGLIDKVEREDEFIVENESKGIQSSFYKAGRFSPTREQGVHHFQRLIAQFLDM